MDLQQQNPSSSSNSSGHAPYFEMMSDKCKSPTAALTCPEAPKDHSVLPEVLQSDEYSDTAAKSASSPVPEASLVPHDENLENGENEEESMESEKEEEGAGGEKDNKEAESDASKSTSAYSIMDILNAGSDKDHDEDKNNEDNVTATEPPTEQQLKSNLPDTHPLKHGVKSNVVIESPRPVDFDMYHRGSKSEELGAIPASEEGSLLRKNLTGGKTNGSEEKPKGLRSPSTDQFDAWQKQLPQKSTQEPHAKKQKTEQLSPSVAHSYLQGQAAASLWYQNMAVAAASGGGVVSPYPFPGAYTDPLASASAHLGGLYPGYVVPASNGKETEKKPDKMMQTNHAELFYCGKCPRNFTSAEKRLKHELTHPYPKPFNCGLLLKRKAEKTDGADATCLLCGETFPSVILLQAHVAQVHRKQSAAVSPPALKDTVTAAAATATPKYFSCSFCSQFFASRMELMEHEKVHLGRVKPTEQSIKCTRCPQVFTDPLACKEHERKHHAPIPRATLQPEFPEPEIRQALLQDCLRGADMEQAETVPGNNNNSLDNTLEHSCLICQKQFVSSKLLKSHVKFTHLDERPYTCSICSKSFKQKATLKQHEKLHSDEKPYVCNICSRGFVYPSRLKTHSQTCKGEPVMSP